MPTITVALPEERLAKLNEIAKQLGVGPEELVRVSIEEQERVILQLAAGELDRKACTEWLYAHTVETTGA